MLTDMVRTQIQLTDAQVRGLKALAASEGRSMAELIRRRRRDPARPEKRRSRGRQDAQHRSAGSLQLRHP